MHHRRTFLSLLASALLTSAGIPGVQGTIATDAAPSLPCILAGNVVLPDGAAAAGAVVVTSAGGRAVTDGAGEFRLELAPLPAVRELRWSAFLTKSGVTLSASATLALPPLGGAVAAGTLELGSGPCAPDWIPTFGSGSIGNELTDKVIDLVVFDDGLGGGPALFAGGSFQIAGGGNASNVARWDGSAWSPLGAGVNDSVAALAVYDDGSGGGPALYAGGSFTTAGGARALRIAKWDGVVWSKLGSGIASGVVSDLTVYDDGSGAGPALYAGGGFMTAGGVSANCVAKWDGSTWSNLSSGLLREYPGFSSVSSLAVHDGGGGAALYVGGRFDTAGGIGAKNVAKWDGAHWSALGAGVPLRVKALASYDDGLGAGPALFLGDSGGYVRRWQGGAWTVIGSMNDAVLGFASYDDGGGSGVQLYACGSFTDADGVVAKRVARWDGASWSPVGVGMDAPVAALAAYDASGSGSVLIAASGLTSTGGIAVGNLARWDGTSWSALFEGLNGGVDDVASFDDGSGAALYAVGDFTLGGGVVLNHVGRWDGSGWSALGSGTNYGANAVCAYDGGLGPALYVGGAFNQAGGSTASRIARWDGNSWSSVGPGVTNGPVYALLVHDDGSGPALYAGGDFTTITGTSANYVAKWNGTNWSPLGAGTGGAVSVMAVFDDGGGPALFVGGDFALAGGSTVHFIAKWDGSSWSGLDGGTSTWVGALAVYDDGRGPALYAGGSFITAGGIPALHVARWDGSSWSAVGGGTNGRVDDLFVYDEGSGIGPVLFAGGQFTTAGGASARHVARWNGSAWSTLGAGMEGSNFDTVSCLAGHDDAGGLGPALIAGGSFPASPAGDRFLARWGGCAPAETGLLLCFGDGSAGPCPCGNESAPADRAGCRHSQGAGGALRAQGSASLSDDTLVLLGSHMRDQPVLYFQGATSHAAIPFGDGLKCTGGPFVRLGIELNGGGASSFPGPSDLPISARGMVTQPGPRWYQARYRDPASYCTPDNFNYSNAVRIDWMP